MGFTKIMKSQENPDGITGHTEREVFDLIRRNAPKKRKYTGNRTWREEKWINDPRHFETQNNLPSILEIREMKKGCKFVARHCRLSHCYNCQRKRDLEIQTNNQIRRGLKLLERQGTS